jgi:hypothetical protein
MIRISDAARMLYVALGDGHAYYPGDKEVSFVSRDSAYQFKRAYPDWVVTWWGVWNQAQVANLSDVFMSAWGQAKV